MRIIIFQIATIVHSRQARVNFDTLWLDLYEKVILEVQADKVTPLAINPGRILLSTDKLYFQPYNNIEAVRERCFESINFHIMLCFSIPF